MGLEEKFDEILRSNKELVKSRVRTPRKEVLNVQDIEYVASVYESNKFKDRLTGDTYFEEKRLPHFHEFLACLDTAEEVNVVCLRLIENLSFPKIASIYGKSESHIRQDVYNKAIEKIRERVPYHGKHFKTSDQT